MDFDVYQAAGATIVCDLRLVNPYLSFFLKATAQNGVNFVNHSITLFALSNATLMFAQIFSSPSNS